MKFSILIAHYNNWEYFQATYQSILAQSYKNYEIIIVDDCSSNVDDFENLKKLSKENSNIKLLKNDVNKGVGYTKAKLIKNASGDVVGFLDPDDVLHEKAIEISMLKHKNMPDIVATYSQIMLCDENLNPESIYPRSKQIKNNNKYFFNINNEVSHFFTFKRKFYDQTTGINEELTSSVDFDLYLKLYELGDFNFISQPLYFYRQHEKGVSQDKNRKETINKNWDRVLYDTCVRRNIQQIGKNKIVSENNLSKVIFGWENSFLKKLKNKISNLC